MTAKELISDTLMAVNPACTGSDALGLMDEFRVSHLPVVDDSQYLGLISDSDIYNKGEFEQAAWDARLNYPKPFVYEHQHVYDVILMMSDQKLSLLPVLNARNQYAGAISIGGLVRMLPSMISLEQPGGIIVLEVNQKDYLLTEIAGIVESNDAKILSLYISSHPESTRLDVTIKVNVTDIGAILQTFSRYNYLVRASWSKEDSFSEGLQDRFDSLMNYLNI